MKAVLLVGGLGTRLRPAVPSLPKALASVGDRPFLELLVQQLCSQGVCQLVMCTGYLSNQIEETFGNGSDLGVTIQYSKEKAPLGTAGALKFAQSYLQYESEFLVLNGDSFLEVDFAKLIKFHRDHGRLATITVVSVKNASRYGTVRVGADGRVLDFAEKTGDSAPGRINAGVYVFNNAILASIPNEPGSLERDVFPMFQERDMFAFEQQGLFIDIGTPEDYSRANQMCDQLTKAFSSKR
jgi:D-glycero-alpha-D-manno-heptose 1-phosphate guanylyltransferase